MPRNQRKPPSTLDVYYGPVADWMKTQSTYAIGQAAIDEVDKLARDCAKRWGEDRVRLLVSELTRAKFDRQRLKLNAANSNGTIEDIKREASRMCAAWRAVDREAEQSGADPISPDIIAEVTLDNGTVAAIVETIDHAKAVREDGRRKITFTIEEIGRLLSTSRQVLGVKEIIPGAEVIGTREVKTPKPDDHFWKTGDDIPF